MLEPLQIFCILKAAESSVMTRSAWCSTRSIQSIIYVIVILSVPYLNSAQYMHYVCVMGILSKYVEGNPSNCISWSIRCREGSTLFKLYLHTIWDMQQCDGSMNQNHKSWLYWKNSFSTLHLFVLKKISKFLNPFQDQIFSVVNSFLPLHLKTDMLMHSLVKKTE